MTALTDRDPIPCTAWECPGCYEWHGTEDEAAGCCNRGECNCPHCDRCGRDPEKQAAIKCPDCGYLDDVYGHADMEARKCCSALPVEQQERKDE